ncbi:hypothetical protein ACFFGH_15995 [Lysobacter korlensis]|uniref:Uncharacterized protein n=1 Tax=Lysobacter korlensis TaxID=553636 RepID=A0ABV6RQS8_9GAMM
MGQNLASVHFDTAQWAELDAALDTVERLWDPMLVVLERGRRGIAKMGTGSEAFCRATLRVMRENPRLAPVDVDLEEMGRDLATHDELAARRPRVDRLVEKLTDTNVALGSDVMTAALRGYAQLKLNGRGAGLDSLRRDLGKQFEKAPRKKPDEAERAA